MRNEINDEVLEQVAGGNININSKTRRLQNSSSGIAYDISPSVDPKDVAMWVYQNYGACGGDDGIIAALKEKGWIS